MRGETLADMMARQCRCEPGQRAVVMTEDAWRNIIEYLDEQELPQDKRIVLNVMKMQTGVDWPKEHGEII